MYGTSKENLVIDLHSIPGQINPYMQYEKYTCNVWVVKTHDTSLGKMA